MRVDRDRLFDGLAATFGLDAATPKIMSSDGESAARVFVPIGGERVKALQSLIIKAHTFLLVQGEMIRSISCYETANESAAEQVYRAVDELVDKQFELLRGTRRSGMSIDDGRAALELDQERGFIRRLTITEKDAPKERAASSAVISAIARGPFVVQITASSGENSDELIRTIAAQLIARLDSGNALVRVPDVDRNDSLVVALGRVKPLLGEGGWTEEFCKLGKAGVEQLVAGDLKGEVALEVGFRSGQSVLLEAADEPRERRRLVAVFLIALESEESAQLLNESVGRALGKFISARTPNATVNESVTGRLATGEPWHRVTGEFSFMEEHMSVAAGTMQRGRLVAYWFDLRDVIGPERLPAFADALFGPDH